MNADMFYQIRSVCGDVRALVTCKGLVTSVVFDVVQDGTPGSRSIRAEGALKRFFSTVPAHVI